MGADRDGALRPQRERLELCVTYVAKGVALGVKPGSIEFVDRRAGQGSETITGEGHVRLVAGVSFYVNTSEFGIGRSVNNDLFVDSGKISRSHIKIVACADESYLLRDLGSANGSALSGRPLARNEECKLHDSGEIQLAGVFHIKYADFGATDVTPESKTIYGITLGHADRRVSMQGGDPDEELRLSNSEYQFLNLLMEAYPDPVSHRDLAYAIWGWEADNADDEKRVRDALFNIVKRLRERLEILDPDHEYIETVRKWGEREGGYRFTKQ
jgi:DNA-binding winged helix-turn-helix (wHTH) protein